MFAGMIGCQPCITQQSNCINMNILHARLNVRVIVVKRVIEMQNQSAIVKQTHSLLLHLAKVGNIKAKLKAVLVCRREK